jgi:Protein of unknown function (DUF3723)
MLFQEVNISNESLERYRKPLTHDQKRDRLHFLDKLHNTNKEVSNKMSSIFVLRSVYFAYFNWLSGDTAMSTTSVRAPDPRAVQEGLEREQQALRIHRWIEI